MQCQQVQYINSPYFFWALEGGVLFSTCPSITFLLRSTTNVEHFPLERVEGSLHPCETVPNCWFYQSWSYSFWHLLMDFQLPFSFNFLILFCCSALSQPAFLSKDFWSSHSRLKEGERCQWQLHALRISEVNLHFAKGFSHLNWSSSCDLAQVESKWGDHDSSSYLGVKSRSLWKEVLRPKYSHASSAPAVVREKIAAGLFPVPKLLQGAKTRA